jgi:hypothetical protein
MYTLLKFGLLSTYVLKILNWLFSVTGIQISLS